MEKILIKTEFIKLNQLLKLSNLACSGSQANIFIKDGLVRVNEQTVFQRGKKIYKGDIVELNNNKIIVTTT